MPLQRTPQTSTTPPSSKRASDLLKGVIHQRFTAVTTGRITAGNTVSADTSDQRKVTGKQVFHNFFGVSVFVLLLRLEVRAVIMHSSEKRRKLLLRAFALLLIRKKASAKQKKKVWMKSWLRKRQSLGSYGNIFKELRFIKFHV